MRIAIGCDDVGFPLKGAIIGALESGGHVVLDLGSFSPDPVDYPDYARVVGQAVLRGFAEGGVLVCGTGIGMVITANKVAGVRAALCPDLYTARMSREHNDANVLALGGRLMGPEMALDILRIWLEADFSGGRHRRRLDKIVDLERRHGTPRPGGGSDGLA